MTLLFPPFRLWAVFQRGSAHEGTPNAIYRVGGGLPPGETEPVGTRTQPPPENVAGAHAVVGMAGSPAGPWIASTPLNRPCGYVPGCGVEV